MIRKKIRKIPIIVFFMALFLTIALYADSKPDYSNAETVVSELYKLVTFGKGTTPDWDKVKDLFLDNAVIVLRTGRTEMRVLSRQEFVDLFVHDIEKYRFKETGFSEKVAKHSISELGDVACGMVLYEASIPGSGRPPQKGLDMFHLVKKGDRWYIVSIINEIPRKGVPIPEELR